MVWLFGVDTVAHFGAINTVGNTIAVLGGGFNNIFPPENIDLFQNIINQNGLVLTEYSENEKVLSKNFPVRNRIVAGLALAVLVIESGYRSGASLTANIAKKQGKKVFCLPCDINNKNNKTNELIQKGATLVINPEEILKELSIKGLENIEYSSTTKKQNSTQQHVLPEYKEIYKLLESRSITYKRNIY